MTSPSDALELPWPGPSSVDAVELRRVRVPLLEPFVAAHGTEHEREVVLVRVVGHDGVEGWGECAALSAPTYTAETTATAWAVLSEVLVPAFLTATGGPARATAGAANPMARAALETALVDLALRREGRPLVEVLGGERRPLDACAVVGLQADVAATVTAAARRADEGYRSLKLKVAPGRDLDRVAAVRAELPAIGLAVDANGSYGARDVDVLVALAELGLDYVEQPLPAGDLDGTAAVTRALPAPVALDESIGSLDDLERAITTGAGSIVNLKPGRVGGLAASMAALDRLARADGWTAFVGGMLELGVGRAVALAVASHPGCTLATDLGPSDRYVADDVTEPIPLLAAGRLEVPAGPGIGVTPRPDRLEATTIDRCELRP